MIKDYKLKKIINVFSIFMIFIILVFVVFEYIKLNTMYKTQINITENLVGALVEKYPDEEVNIIESIYNMDKSKSDIGKGVLNRFGYGISNRMTNDEVFSSYLKEFIISDIIAFLIICIFIITIFMIFIKYIKNNLEKVYFRIDNIIKEEYQNEEYEYNDEYLKESIFSHIYDNIIKLERRLRLKFSKLNKEKENLKSLVTDISHQLKTPLASLNLYNTLLIEEELDESEEIEFLNTNKYSIDKLNNLIDALVSISRLEVNMINIKKEDFNIKETINKAIIAVTPKAKNKNITINLENFNDKVIPHDKKWTEESIFNILDNAVKYTDEGGYINIYTEESINYFKINIEDNGMGIDPKEFNNIFKRFYRVDSKEVENIEGSGVGLYLSRKIIEEQGGNVIVSSRLGKGSKFTIFLTTL